MFLTDLCQLASFKVSELEAYAVVPVCRFYPSLFQSAGTLLLNTTYGNSTDLSQTVIACPVSSLLPAGSYVIHLSSDGGATFDLPVINSATILTSTLVVGPPSSSNSNTTSALNVSTVSLQHPYDSRVDSFSPGYNVGDMQLITWQAPIDAPAYLTLTLEVTYVSWTSTSLVSSPLILSETCYVIANSLSSNQSSYVWSLPNITTVLQSLAIDVGCVVDLSIGAYYTSTRLATSNTTNPGSTGGRRLLFTPFLAGLAIVVGIIVGVWTLYKDSASIRAEDRKVSTLTILRADLQSFEKSIGQAIGIIVSIECQLGSVLCDIYYYIYGDVHLLTMDGLHYDFQAVGVFWLMLTNPAVHSQYNVSGFAMQLQLQPLTYSIPPGSPSALSYRGVIYMAGIAFQADSTCGIITITPTAAVSPLSQTYFQITDAGVNVEIQYLEPETYASAIAYQLSCATIYLTAPGTAVIDTYNGYSITLSTCAGYGRLCSLTTNLPSYAFNSTQGLVGSWDGNATNDFVDASGHDWFKTYPGNVGAQGAYAGSYGPNDAAGYAFGLTWTVQPNQSFFVSSSPPQIECQIVEDNTTLFSMGCLFGNPSNGSNLLAYGVNVTSVLQNFDPLTLPVPPVIWPNTTLQAQAVTACEAATGIYNASNVLVQNCLLDVYVLNSTSGAIATSQVAAQMAIHSVELPILNVTRVTQSQAWIAIYASSSLIENGGHCSAIFLSLNGLAAPGANQTQCIYVMQSGSGAYYTSVDIPSNLQQNKTDASMLSMSLGSLTASTGYNVRVAFLVVTSRTNNSMQTGWTSATLTTLAAVVNVISSSSGTHSVSSSATGASSYGSSSSRPSSYSSSSLGTGAFSSSSSSISALSSSSSRISAASSSLPGTSLSGPSSSTTGSTRVSSSALPSIVSSGGVSTGSGSGSGAGLSGSSSGMIASSSGSSGAASSASAGAISSSSMSTTARSPSSSSVSPGSSSTPVSTSTMRGVSGISSSTADGFGGVGGAGSFISSSSSTASNEAASSSLTVPTIIGISIGVAVGVAIIIIILAAIKGVIKAGVVWGSGVVNIPPTPIAISTATGELETGVQLVSCISPISSSSSSVSHSASVLFPHETITPLSPSSPVHVPSPPTIPATSTTGTEPAMNSSIILNQGAAFVVQLMARAAASVDNSYAHRIAAIASCVAFVRIGDRIGSGFLLAENLFATCCHVIRTEDEARRAVVTIFRFNHTSNRRHRVKCRLNPAGFFVSSAASDYRRERERPPQHPLDFVLVELQRPTNDHHPDGASTPSFPSSPASPSSPPFSTAFPAVSAGLEHQLAASDWQTNTASPNFGNVRVVGCHATEQVPVSHESQPLLRLGSNRLGSSQFPIEYMTNTEPCYSGGVVLDKDWLVVGMHQRHSPAADANQGMPIQVLLHQAAVILGEHGSEVEYSNYNLTVMEQFARLLRAQNIQ